MRQGELSIRIMRDDERDHALLDSWLSDPRVLEWYDVRDQPFDLDRVRESSSPRVPDEEGFERCIVSEGDTPVGYLQFYPAGPFACEYEINAGVDASQIWAFDLFLGDPERWGNGLGTTMLSMLVAYLFVERRAERVLVDPFVDNARAIRSYEKAGFLRRKVLAGHEVHEGQARDRWLMELDALDHPVGLTARLAEIDSVNPSLVPGAPGEGKMAEFMAAWCEKRGFEVHRRELAPGRFNVVAIRRGSGGGRSLLFNGHLDTVGTTGPDTKRVRLVDGRLEGRGVLDTKGGLAAGMLATASIAAGELAGDVILAGVADEEYGSIGTEALVAEWPADGAVMLEPTSFAIILRHRGFAVVEVACTGRSAHSSRPERGVNAVHAAARATLAVVELDARWARESSDPVERPAVLVNRVRSTGETFTVPARCELTVEVRTTAGKAPHQIDEAIRAVGSAAADVEVEAKVVLARPPLGLPDGHPLVTELAAALGRVLNREPELTAAPYWTDAALHAEHGTPAVVLGPTGEGLHENLEWVAPESLTQFAEVLARFIRGWCGPARPRTDRPRRGGGGGGRGGFGGGRGRY